ncbi:MAG: type I DNA topoisomerase [bacterium]|nr:type I DNA topoisomerase [bacterium]
MKLVIVESPTKAKTISKFLGKDYKVESSFGHIMDLPAKELGVDLNDYYAPTYIIPAKAKKIVSKLKELAKKADGVILATDEDREGEAISWHLAEALKLKEADIKRIAFHEITKSAIEAALKNPRQLDKFLIDAQQARRVLDRLVGYKLSPFLWKKIARGLSAGRVQSVAVRLVVEREEEIKKFAVQKYWTIKSLLLSDKKEELEANLTKVGGKTLKKFDIKSTAEANKLKEDLETATYKINNIEKKNTSKSPLPPFTTATLQQTANARLGYSAKKTMMLAQKLYETGLITYMRTDSVNLATQFIDSARDFIKKEYGEKYLPEKARAYRAKAKNTQEAHEAIRPTDAAKLAGNIGGGLTHDHQKMYELIWQRALGSQAAKATLDNTSIDIEAKSAGENYDLRATGQIIIFDGYLKIYPQTTKENILPNLKNGENLDLEKVLSEEHATEPPARYSDATLVKALEKYGIGRPSTYAPTISTIISRNYVERDDKKRLAPTDVAFVVNKLLVEHFPEIVDFEFTAGLENDLDDIAAGKNKWQDIIDNFYQPFSANLEKKDKELNKKELTEEKTDEICEKCSAPMVIKMGRFGKFMACTNYPDCKNTKQITTGDKDHDGQKDQPQLKEFGKKYAGKKCDKCGSDMIAKIGRFGPFIACSNYPKCKNILDTNGTGIPCPECAKRIAESKDKKGLPAETLMKAGEITKKRSRRGIFYACNAYPDCKFALWGKPTGGKCKTCGSLMVESKDEVKCSNKECKM